jgi:cytochrome bd-type quinol oxidase subunit 2
MANTTSQHILPTSANLLGFCLFVITSLHITNSATSSLIDEFTSLIALLFAFSCLLSFLAIRATDRAKEQRAERLADYLFLAALVGIVGIILLLIFRVIR